MDDLGVPPFSILENLKKNGFQSITNQPKTDGLTPWQLNLGNTAQLRFPIGGWYQEFATSWWNTNQTGVHVYQICPILFWVRPSKYPNFAALVIIQLRSLWVKFLVVEQQHMGVSTNGGTAKMMFHKGKSFYLLQMDDLGVPPFMETPT